MILRRIAEHVQAQNWFAVGIDFVIVVVGVFMGLQVQEWSVERAAREDLNARLTSFRTELVLARTEFDNFQQYYQDRIDAATELRAQLDDAEGSLTEDSFNRLMWSSMRNSSLDLVFPSFDGLSSSESISRISDDSLREWLFRWNNQRASIQSNDIVVEELRNTIAIPATIGVMNAASAYASDPRYAHLTVSDRFSFDLQAIRNNLELDNVIALRQINAEAQLALLTQFREITEDLILVLDTRAQ